MNAISDSLSFRKPSLWLRLLTYMLSMLVHSSCSCRLVRAASGLESFLCTFADGSSADYLDDPLYGHSRYRKLKDLNEGTFGIVLLAMDIRSKEQIGILQCASPLIS